MDILKNKKIILISVSLGLIIILTTIALLIWQKEEEAEAPPQRPGEEVLIELPNLPKEKWLRPIDLNLNEDTGMLTITNSYDGYRITVPASRWEAQDVASKEGGLKIYYTGPQKKDEEGAHIEDHIAQNQIHAEHADMFVSILTYQNEEGFSIVDWLARSPETLLYRKNQRFQKVALGKYTAYKLTRKMEREGFNEQGDIVIEVIEQSQITDYFVEGKNRFYKISCWAQGKSYLNLTELCNNRMQSFTIL
ncbi:MAG: hypothetical protein R3251_02935 [Candidatus Spechtbacterales bacterium]|nr:hypothetical protein [Candidatus Spechtbacterales bacterium]